MSDPIALVQSAVPVVQSVLGVVKDARNFFIEIEANEKETNRVNKMWSSLSFTLPATDSGEVERLLKSLPACERPPVADVLYVATIHLGIRIGVSGLAKDDRIRSYPFGVVLKSVLKQFKEASKALRFAQAGATPVAAGLSHDSEAHRALVAALQAMAPFAPRASTWDILQGNDIVEHLKSRVSDVSPTVLGREMAFRYTNACKCYCYPFATDQSKKQWKEEDINNLFAELTDKVVRPLVDTYSTKNLHGGGVAVAVQAHAQGAGEGAASPSGAGVSLALAPLGALGMRRGQKMLLVFPSTSEQPVELKSPM